MQTLSLVVAALLFAAHFAAEPLMRRGRARSLATTGFEGRSTLLVTALGLVSVIGSFAARFSLEPGRFAPGPRLLALLALVMLAGVALRYWSMRTLGEFFTRTLTVLPDQRVVSTGPYRVVRHPGYLAQLLVLGSGSALASLDLRVFAFFALLLLAAYAYRIRIEERMLESQLGEAYRVYRSRTWRLLPGVY